LETIVKAKILTGKREFRVTYDKTSEMLVIEATKQPDKGKANTEIVKELKKKFKTEVMIVSGLKSREKMIKLGLSKEQLLQIIENTN
jgi:uncharacterized protein (TIGR00251 family)